MHVHLKKQNQKQTKNTQQNKQWKDNSAADKIQCRYEVVQIGKKYSNITV